MDAHSVEFALEDTSGGYPVSPDQVPLNVLRLFANDVDQFVRGERGDVPPSIRVAVRAGSFALATQPLSSPSLFGDLRLLASGSQLIDNLDSKRRAVIERWQRFAKSKRLRMAFRIRSSALPEDIVVTRQTDFHTDDANQWVRVERHMPGEIDTIGGVEPNVHVRLPNGKRVVVNARRDQLQSEEKNRLYKTAVIRFRAEYNIVTRDYRQAELIEFTDYSTKPDVEQVARMRERGAAAWADVPDAQRWVEELRGGGA
jgi:hypothetical protein